MGERQEKFDKKVQEEYLTNAKALCYFCLEIGLSKEEALTIAQLPLTLKNLQYAYEKKKHNLKDFKRMVKNWYLKMERNRLESMLLSLPDEDTMTTPASKFPILVRFNDCTKARFDRPEDIPAGVEFTVLETNYERTDLKTNEEVKICC
jgi:hypothetical protein